MIEKILIVEDEFVVAHDLQMTLKKAGYAVIGIAASYSQALSIIELNKPDLVLLDIYLKGKLTGIDLAKQLLIWHIPFIYISANSNEKVLEAAKDTQPYGFIVKPYRDSDVLLSIDIARYRYQHSMNIKMSTELYMQGFLEDLGKMPVSWEQKLLQISSAFQPYIPFDFIIILGLTKENPVYHETSISRTRFNEYEIISFPEFLKLAHINKEGFKAIHHLIPELLTDGAYSGDDFIALRQKSPLKNLIAKTFGLESNLIKAIQLDNGDTVVLSFYSRLNQVYKREHLDLLTYLNNTLTANLEGITNFEKEKATSVKVYEKISTTSFKTDTDIKFQGIVGSSAALLNVLDQIKIVAPTDTSVLITGESGTGKEKIVKNLHLLSPRSRQALVTINCAAIPSDLIESILFGHEKGSFTGATESRAGKFEEANGGTIFLDEIGEMPFDLQSKLLRVLQEKEIERIGGKLPISVNLRIIAATNRNLGKEIAAGRFRLDLYYRLNIFPIHVPSLRERKDDIPLLVNHFLDLHAKKLKKNIKGISAKMMADFMRYNWPGNIRELDHLIERSVLLSQTSIIDENFLDVPNSDYELDSNRKQVIKTIAENERDYIMEVLKKCDGKIAGEGGAAELLGIPATTLSSKIKKLGIKR